MSGPRVRQLNAGQLGGGGERCRESGGSGRALGGDALLREVWYVKGPGEVDGLGRERVGRGRFVAARAGHTDAARAVVLWQGREKKRNEC